MAAVSTTSPSLPPSGSGPSSSSLSNANAKAATASATPGAGASASASANAVPGFEFTRRKRWADLLINELSEAITLVLSVTGKVLFCSHSVLELLGWRDDEVVDGDLLQWMNGGDHESFRAAFEGTLADGREMLVYARLRCKTLAFEYPGAGAGAKEVLFEIYGYPHFVPGEQLARCFFAVAKPYPSRNTAMLNTFLELKIENARLQHRLQALRGQAQGVFASQAGGGEPLAANLGLDAAPSLREPASYYSPASHNYGNAMYATEEEDEQKRKKVRGYRKVIAAEQHVCNTCGRTDSPEWRKGPRGPKTLCNACGLRWAKKVRKFEESGGDPSQQPLDDIVPP
ncbi:hypothetical protein OF83DRAFT_1058454 [Amylostereum chailletii]|nr:hypothetical protein OF83DRAFT_1058454 [Amylostereum chailletii]